MRIVVYPIIKRRHHPLQMPKPLLLGDHHLGPARKPTQKILYPLQLRPRPRRRARRRRAQLLHLAALRRIRQSLHLDAQRRRKPRHHLRTDLAAVMLDQVKIRGRDPRPPRQIRLPDPQGKTPLAHPASRQSRHRHRITPNLQTKFTTTPKIYKPSPPSQNPAPFICSKISSGVTFIVLHASAIHLFC